MGSFRRHLTYANVVLTVLAFIVLGGGAWAFANNSVGTKQLKNSAVSSKKIKTGAVTRAKIANGAVTGTAINPATFPVTVYQQAVAPIPKFGFNGATASCPAGKKAIGGGGLSDTGGNVGEIEDSRPVTDTNIGATQGGTFTGWRAFWENASGQNINAIVYVICLG